MRRSGSLFSSQHRSCGPGVADPRERPGEPALGACGCVGGPLQESRHRVLAPHGSQRPPQCRYVFVCVCAMLSLLVRDANDQ